MRSRIEAGDTMDAPKLLSKKPFSIAKALRSLVYDGKSVAEAAVHLK